MLYMDVCLYIFVAEVSTKTFARCRGNDITDKTFTLSDCPVGDVINIQSAEVWIYTQWKPTKNPPSCSWVNATCRRSIKDHQDIKKCNGQRSCSFSQMIFIFSPETPLCAEHKDANFIRITYTCTSGT